MQHRYIQGAEASPSSGYNIVISTVSLDHAAKETWTKLTRLLEYAVPTGMVKIELLELAALHVFYFETTDVHCVDFEDFDDLADILMQGAGLDEKEEAMTKHGTVMLYLAELFEGYLRLFLHVRRRFKVARGSVHEVAVKRLSNVVTSSDDYNDDGTSSYVLVLR